MKRRRDTAKKFRKRKAYKQSIDFDIMRGITNARIGGFMGMELKFYDQDVTNDTLTAPPNASSGEHDPITGTLSAPAQGTAPDQRDGRTITMKSIHVRGILELAAVTNAPYEIPSVYIALVLDKQTNGAQLNSENVFVNPSGSSINATNPFRNLEYTKRFRVLAAQRFTIDQPHAAFNGVNVSIGGVQRVFAFNHEFKKGIEANFSAPGQGVGSAVDHSLHIIAYATNTLGPGLNLSYNSRLRFVG